MDEDEFVAFVDESEPLQDVEPGTYMLAAAILRRSDAASIRSAAARLRRPGQAKAHWHDERTLAGRNRLSEAGASAAVDHLVIIRVGDPSAGSERRRRLCLERLCFELYGMGVRAVTFESRGPADKLDRNLVDALRARKLIDATLRVDHISGPGEPLLWFPDIVCGAVNQDRAGVTSFFDKFRDRAIVIEI